MRRRLAPACRAAWGRPSPDDRGPATRAPPAPRPVRSPRASRARDGHAGGASARAPTTRGDPTTSASVPAGRTRSRAGNRRARHPVRACAARCGRDRCRATPCAWASGGLCHRCVPTRRTSADQPRSARSPPAPALVASSGVCTQARSSQPSVAVISEPRAGDPFGVVEQRAGGGERGRASPRGSRSTAAPAASCRPRPRRRRRRARRARAGRRRAASPAPPASDPGGSRAPGRARRPPPDGRGRRRAWPHRSTAATTPARGGRSGVCTGPASCAIEAWPKTSRSAAYG